MQCVFGRPGFCIVPEIERPSRAEIEALGRFPVALIGDGIGRRSIMNSAIKALSPSMRCAGPAVTVEVHAGDNLMIHAALKVVKPGDVLVINGRGDLNHGIWGGLVTAMARRIGVAGVVVDAAVRDSAELIDSGLAVFARGVNPTGGGKDGPGQVNMPTSCGGVIVQPGDIVVGDGDGVIVVPAAQAAEAARLAAQCEASEAKRVDAIENGPLEGMYPAWLVSVLREKGVLKDDETI